MNGRYIETYTRTNFLLLSPHKHTKKLYNERNEEKKKKENERGTKATGKLIKIETKSNRIKLEIRFIIELFFFVFEFK